MARWREGEGGRERGKGVIHLWKEGRSARWEGLMDGCVDGPTDRVMDGQMDGWLC